MTITHILVFGQVQGIGYRNFVKHHARKLGLIGWVRNLPEGTVEAEIAGSDDAIEQLIRLCRKGPFLADVTHVDVLKDEKDFPFADFSVRHDLE